MALHWRPVGPEPAQTYWWRRTTLAIGVFFVLYVLARLLSGGDEPDRLSTQDGATPQPSVSASASPSAAAPDGSAVASSGIPQACLPAALKLTAKADKTDYPAGGRPVLELAVAHDGPAPCTVDLGQAAVELLVMSGSDRIWSSDDCASGKAAKVVTLEPRKADVTRLTWAGRRSLPGCEGAKGQAQPGTYRVAGRVGEQRVQGDSFRIVE